MLLLGDLKDPITLTVTPVNHAHLQGALQAYRRELRQEWAKATEPHTEQAYAELIREMDRLSSDLGSQALPQIEAQRKAWAPEVQS